MPSVLSAWMLPSASKRSVFTACASVARSLVCCASAAASNLKGTVTLQPRAVSPCAAASLRKAAMPSAKAPIGTRRRP
ncbi:hypothetical protein D9M72_193090 [compost metagenome]